MTTLASLQPNFAATWSRPAWSRTADHRATFELQTRHLLLRRGWSYWPNDSSWTAEAGFLGDVEPIADLFGLDDYEAVASFLEQRPYLVPLLLDTFTAVQHFFGTGTPITLKVVRDIEAATPQLLALIKTRLQLDSALLALERFDENWWMRASVGWVGLFNIDISIGVEQ